MGQAGGIPCRVTAVETCSVECVKPADPANPDSETRVCGNPSTWSTMYWISYLTTHTHIHTHTHAHTHTHTHTYTHAYAHTHMHTHTYTHTPQVISQAGQVW